MPFNQGQGIVNLKKKNHWKKEYYRYKKNTGHGKKTK